ncbi:hypothetical protein AMECASPLE_035107 [Ameca splendens]|uniref:Uncharacterized protein n=1 Tax=Ameca splendens TaxID=208324 RepID=A0ABV0XW99_9TELE
MHPVFLCSALPTSDILLASEFWTSTLLLPPDYPSLPNPWISLPKSTSPFMILLLCPDQRFKPFPRILSPDSASPALTQTETGSKLGSANLRARTVTVCHCTAATGSSHCGTEIQFPFLSTDSEKRFLSLPPVLSCRSSSRAFNESYLLCLAEISGPLNYLLYDYIG